jgi:endogenous inhibitor of DNA gyrase (YacG/DUF329 family)
MTQAISTSFRPRCPTCDMVVEPERAGNNVPFCSNRCRLIDLGRWLNEEHTLTCQADQDDQTEEASGQVQLPPGWHDA